MHCSKLLRRFWNLTVTLLLWSYFMVGFVLLYAPRYLWHCFRQRCHNESSETAFQNLNHRFAGSFFRVAAFLIPSLQLRLHPAIKNLHATVIVCNHHSYLDPLILIATFPVHTTIVKARLFQIPVFGWFLTRAGYLPSAFESAQVDRLNRQLTELETFFDRGGNFFIFPEGTRSRDGRLGPLHKSAFRIARRYHRPLAVLQLQNTHHYYPPDRFSFNTAPAAPVTVTLLAVLAAENHRVAELQHQVRRIMDKGN